MKFIPTDERYCIKCTPPSPIQKKYIRSIHSLLLNIAASAADYVQNIPFPQLNISAEKKYYPKKHLFKKHSVDCVKLIKFTASHTAYAGLSMLLLLCIGSAVVFSYCTPCYKITNSQKFICFCKNPTEYTSALSAVNSRLTQTTDTASQLHLSPTVELAIVPQTFITPQNDIYNNIALLSDNMQNAYVLLSDDLEVAYFKTKTDLDAALDMYIKRFSQNSESHSILNTVSSAEKVVPTALIITPDKLETSNLINVRTISTVTEDLPIPYTSEKINDDDMYEDESITVTAGSDGAKTITSSITAVNGIEIEKKQLSETICAEPVNEVIRIGTKKRPTGIGSGNFLFPTNGVISSRFGMRWNRLHKGLDIANDTGTDIRAADEGIVCYSGEMSGYGNIIIIDHKNGYKTYYGHCSKLYAKNGSVVSKGDIIAAMGSTGNSTGPHLHFEIRKDNTPLDPSEFVKQ